MLPIAQCVDPHGIHKDIKKAGIDGFIKNGAAELAAYVDVGLTEPRYGLIMMMEGSKHQSCGLERPRSGGACTIRCRTGHARASA